MGRPAAQLRLLGRLFRNPQADASMKTRDHLDSWRDRTESLLCDKKLAIAAEIAIVLLLPALWGFLPLPRTIIPLLLLTWLSLWLRRLSWGDLGLCRPRSWPVTVFAGLGAGGLTVFFAKVVLPIVLRVVRKEYEPSGLYPLEGNFPAFLMLLVGTWLLAALMEEMVYRGYILNRLVDLFGRGRWGWGVSFVLSALIFSWAHGVYDLWFLLMTFLHGLLLGSLYLLGHRNLWFSIIAHGTGITVNLTLAFFGVV